MYIVYKRYITHIHSMYTITYIAMMNSEIGPFEIQLIITPSSRRVCKCSQQFLDIIIMRSFDFFSLNYSTLLLFWSEFRLKLAYSNFSAIPLANF